MKRKFTIAGSFFMAITAGYALEVQKLNISALNISSIGTAATAAKINVDTSRFSTLLNNQGLTTKFDNIIGTAINKNELIKLYPCLSAITPLQLSTYRDRLSLLMKYKLSKRTANFASAITTTAPAFTQERKAFASARATAAARGKRLSPTLLKANTFIALKGFQISPLSVVNHSSGTVASAGTAATETIGTTLTGDSDSFRAYPIDGQMKCQVKYDGEWRTITSEEFYIKTPCYTIGVDLGEDELEPTDEETSTGVACTPTKWKAHVLDFAWKNLSADRDIFRKPIFPHLVQQQVLNEALINSAGVVINPIP